jgi:DNA helicase HerA-like ATPase
MTENPETAERVAEMAAAYAVDGPALELGALLWDGVCDAGARVRLPLAMLNRHALVAGASGTGKTKTLQLMAEQLSEQGVPVFLADIKGDISGISAPGVRDQAVTRRAAEVGQDWRAAACPCEFYALGGVGAGIPLRTAMTAFGPLLLARVLALGPAEEHALGQVFHYADRRGLELEGLRDLRSVLAFLLSEPGGPELKGIGGLTPVTAGSLLRGLTVFESQGADAFFGTPGFESAELLRQVPDGRGVVSVLELPGVQDRPRLFSTFLMWLLADLSETLPEAVDGEKPRLVFFVDEAHLLFDGASPAFLAAISQTVRLIRSRGVGVVLVAGAILWKGGARGRGARR